MNAPAMDSTSTRRASVPRDALALAPLSPSAVSAPWTATIWLSNGTDVARARSRNSWPSNATWPSTRAIRLAPSSEPVATTPKPSSRSRRTIAGDSKSARTSSRSAPSRTPGAHESVPGSASSNRPARVRGLRELIRSTVPSTDLDMSHSARPLAVESRSVTSVASVRRAIESRSAALWRKLSAALGALFLAGCTVVGRDYEAPETKLPQQWLDQPGAVVLREDPDLAHWWRRLDDPVLNGLVERAAAGSLDLRAALARIREARALRGISSSERWPNVDLAASYRRLDDSENTPFGSFAEERDLHDVHLDASWELDLWGRVRRSVEAADAELAATIEDARDVQVSVAAEVALAYVDLRAFQRRLALARTNVQLQED